MAKMSWLLSLALPLLGVGAADAQGLPPEPPPPPHMGGPHMGPPLHSKAVLRKLGLTEDQLKQIDAMRYEADKQKLDLHHGLAKARLELRRLMDAEKPDEGAVFGQLDQLGGLETQLKKNRIGLLLKVRTLLTPAQWEKLQAARPFRKHIVKRYHWTGDGPPPPLPPMPPAPPAPPMP